MPKQTDRLEIRISPNEKNFLIQYCQKTHQTISTCLRELIKQLQQKEENKNAKED